MVWQVLWKCYEMEHTVGWSIQWDGACVCVFYRYSHLIHYTRGGVIFRNSEMGFICQIYILYLLASYLLSKLSLMEFIPAIFDKHGLFSWNNFFWNPGRCSWFIFMLVGFLHTYLSSANSTWLKTTANKGCFAFVGCLTPTKISALDVVSTSKHFNYSC